MQGRSPAGSSGAGGISDSALRVRQPLQLPSASARMPGNRPAKGPGRPTGPASPDELARARLFAVLGEERSLSARAPQPAPPFGVRPTVRATDLLTSPKRTLRGFFSRRTRLVWRHVLRILRLPVQVSCASIVAYYVLFNFSVVRGSSMAPGIHDGDRILVDQVSYMFRDVQRGDVVVMRYPLDPRVDYIKRIVGLPGDEVTIRGSQVFVNGDLLDEPYVQQPDARSFCSTKVGPQHYFVLGDNRAHSADSREFGQVPRDYLRGKVDVRVWPFSRAGWID